MEITLIRHGKTEWNEKGLVQGQADPPLNDTGKKQAKTLRDNIKEIIGTYEIIYSSPMQRAVQTAEIIRGNSKLTIISDKRLVSRKLGKFSGMTLDEIKTNYQEEYALWVDGDHSFRPPDGESTHELVARTAEFLKFLLENHKETQKIMIFTHRESIGIMHYLIEKEKMKDPLRNLKNCIAFDYILSSDFLRNIT